MGSYESSGPAFLKKKKQKADQDQMEVIVEVVSSESKWNVFFFVAFFGVGPRKPMLKKGN